MNTECTHQEDVTEIDIRREINEQHFWQATQLWGDIREGGARCLNDNEHRGDKRAGTGSQGRGRQRQGCDAVQHSSFPPVGKLASPGASCPVCAWLSE